MRIVILFNPIAGAGHAARSAEAVDRALQRAGHETQRVATSLGPVDEWLVGVLAEAEVLVVVGGDGAVRMAAPAAAAAGVPIRHVPLGTENLFAREWRSRREPSHVVRSLATPAIARMDLGRMGPHAFTIMLTAGFDAEVVHALAARRTGSISHLSYVRPIVYRLCTWRAPRVFVTLGNGRELVQGDRGILIVANCRQYALRIDPALRADPADGMLDVLFLPADTAAGVAAWMLRCGMRRQFSSAALRWERTERLTFVCDPPALMQADGDALAGPAASRETPAEIRIDPAALRVVHG